MSEANAGKNNYIANINYIFEIIFYCFFAFNIFRAFMETTMFDLEWDDTILVILRIALLITVIVKTATGGFWGLRDILRTILFCGGILLYWKYTTSYDNITMMPEVALLVIGAKDVPFNRLVLIFLCVSLPLLIFTAAMALTGHIENLIYYQEAHSLKPRISFGIIYPTDFCAHIFFIICSYLWLRWKHISYPELAIPVAAAAFCFIYCDARMTTLCLCALTIWLIYIKIRTQKLYKNGNIYVMSSWFRILCIFSCPLLAAGSLLLSYFYDPSVKVLAILNRILNNRLLFGHEGFDRYNVRLFGQYVEMHGSGGSTEPVGPAYFYLDNSYVNTVLRFGAIIFIASVAIFFLSVLWECRLNAWGHVAILVMIIISCVIEHHLIEFLYHPFLLLLLADSSNFKKNKLLTSRDRYRYNTFRLIWPK